MRGMRSEHAKLCDFRGEVMIIPKQWIRNKPVKALQEKLKKVSVSRIETRELFRVLFF